MNHAVSVLLFLAYFIWLVHQWMNGKSKCGVYICNGMLFSFKKKKRKGENLSTCNNMGEPGGYYAK